MADSEPRALGRYELVEPIATGTTATVWRARDTKRQIDVVIKRFHPHIVDDPTGRRRIAAEADNVRHLSHPGIVRPIDRVTAGDELALVFPHIPGRTLSALLADDVPLTVERAASLAADVADALAAAHASGIVHRDVKPGNILVGDDGRARLLDFGISRSIAEAQAVESGLTGAGLVVGTLPYMAPEQLTGGTATPATDVYALGAVLYEMLAGRRAYDMTTPLALVNAQNTPPARIDGVPAPLMSLALAAMSVDAAARPTAAGFAAAARGLPDARVALDAPTVAVMAAGQPQPAQPRRRLAPALAAVAAVLVLAVVAVAALPGGIGLPVRLEPTPAITQLAPTAPADTTVVTAADESTAPPSQQPAGRDRQPAPGAQPKADPPPAGGGAGEQGAKGKGGGKGNDKKDKKKPPKGGKRP